MEYKLFRSILDLFGNPVGPLTSIAFFRARARELKFDKNAIFIWKLFRN